MAARGGPALLRPDGIRHPDGRQLSGAQHPDGDAGIDTLTINNHATSLSFEGKVEPVSTDIFMSGRTSGQLFFEDKFGAYIETGKFQEIEKVVAGGTGNLKFTATICRAPAST